MSGRLFIGNVEEGRSFSYRLGFPLAELRRHVREEGENLARLLADAEPA